MSLLRSLGSKQKVYPKDASHVKGKKMQTWHQELWLGFIGIILLFVLLIIGLFDVHRNLISLESNSGWLTPLINSKNKNSNGTSFQADCWATQRVCQILILMPILMLIPNTNTNTQNHRSRTFAHWNSKTRLWYWGSDLDLGGPIYFPILLGERSRAERIFQITG